MKYVLGVIGVIVLLFVAFVLIFNRGDDSPQTTVLRSSQLVEFADKNSSVSVTTYGRVVGNESRNGLRIVVTPGERRLEIMNGYDDNVIRTETYPNTQSAYENFLSALSGQGFLASRETDIKDQRSACPTGNRFIFDLTEDGDLQASLWSVSCNSDVGTFAGRGSTIRQLFQLQIPDYSKQVTGIKL